MIRSVDKRSKASMTNFLFAYAKSEHPNVRSISRLYTKSLDDVCVQDWDIIVQALLSEKGQQYLKETAEQFNDVYGAYPVFNAEKERFELHARADSAATFLSVLDIFEEYQTLDLLKREVIQVQAFDGWCLNIVEQLKDYSAKMTMVHV